MIYRADGTEVGLEQKMAAVKALAQLANTLPDGHRPFLLVGVRFEDPASIAVLLPTPYIRLIQNDEFFETLMNAIREQLNQACGSVPIDVEGKVVDDGEPKAAEYSA